MSAKSIFVLISHLLQNLSFSEVKLIEAFRIDDRVYLQNELQGQGYGKLMIDSLCAKIKKEMSAYSQDPLSSLYKSKADQLADFSLADLVTEFTKKLPTLMGTILKHMQKEDNSKPEIVAVTIVAKILTTHNQRLSALRYVNALVLDLLRTVELVESGR